MRIYNKVLSFIVTILLGITVWALSWFVVFVRLFYYISSFLPLHLQMLLPNTFIYLAPAAAAVFTGFVLSIMNKERLMSLILGFIFAGVYTWFYLGLNGHFSTTTVGLIFGAITMATAVSFAHYVGVKMRGLFCKRSNLVER